MANQCFFHLKKVVFVCFLLIWIGSIGPSDAKELRIRMASPVKVEKIVQKSVRPFVTLIGTAEPSRKSTVASEIEGLVVSFRVILGKRIKKGELLATIEKRPLILQLKQVKASLAEANENYKNALSELRRTEALFEKKTISSRRYDVALYGASALKQRILALEAGIEAIKYDIERCSIKAPFSGFVIEEHTQIGQWLKKGGAVVTIVDMDPILVTVPVPDRYIHFLKVGQGLDLEFDFLPGDKMRKAFVRNIIPQGNEKSRTFPVQIKVANKDLSILAGMSARVRFSAGRPYKALLVNKDAVVTRGDNHHLFLVRDGKAVLMPVKKGYSYGGHVVVEGNISADQLAVVEGNERLRPGQAVRMIGQ